MMYLTKSRLGRSVLHIIAIAHCINHFMNPHLVNHINGILRELKNI